MVDITIKQEGGIALWIKEQLKKTANAQLKDTGRLSTWKGVI